MLSEVWRSMVRRHIAYDVPDDMGACFNCNTAWCPDDKYETCPSRLAQAAALRAAAEPFECGVLRADDASSYTPFRSNAARSVGIDVDAVVERTSARGRSILPVDSRTVG